MLDDAPAPAADDLRRPSEQVPLPLPQGGAKLLARLWRYSGLLRHPRRHAAVRDAVAAPVFAGIRRRQPRLAFKYLHPRYLLRHVGPAERAACFIHHYAVLRQHLRDALLRELLDDGLLLWRMASDAGEHAITLQFSDPTDNEGELTLAYRLEGAPVAVLGFGFAPGPLLGAPAATVALLSRLQRAKGCGDAYRLATRSMRGLAPPAALVAALTGWLEGFAVTTLVGVSAERQVCIDDGCAANFHAVYDDTFAGLGATEAQGLYTLPLPLVDKPLSAVKPGNRPRTRAQRDIKAAIAAAARQSGFTPPAAAEKRTWGVPDRVAPAAPVRVGSGAIALVFTAAFAEMQDGSQVRAAALLDRLVAAEAPVIVYSHADHDAFPWTEAARRAFRARWPGVELALEQPGRLLDLVAACKNLVGSLAPAWAAALLRWRLPGLSPVWDDVWARAGLVVVNYKSALTQLNGLDPATCFVETHDLLWLKWAKLAGASPLSFAALRRLRGEMAMLDATRGVFAISPSEAGLFRMLLGRARTFYVSRWSGPRPVAAVTHDAEPAYDLVFVASAYAMNVRGLVAAFERHGSWLSRYRVAVCGRVCEDPAVVALAARHPGVTLLGFVDDLGPLYRRTKAALVPVDGTGLKMKLVSALEAGLPALATPEVFVGLPDGHEGAVLPLDGITAAALLDDPVRLAAARQAAARYLERFDAVGEANAAMAAMTAVLRRPEVEALSADVTLAPARACATGR